MKKMKNALFYKIILLLFLFCKTDKPINFKNSDEMYLYYSKKLCYKMYECLKPYTRTFKNNYKNRLDPNLCIENVEQRIKSKNYLNNENIQKVAEECYISLLKNNCKNFLTAPYFEDKCLKLRALTFQNYILNNHLQ